MLSFYDGNTIELYIGQEEKTFEEAKVWNLN